MKIDTTVNLKRINTNKIEKVSNEINVTKNFLISEIVKIIISNCYFTKKEPSRIKYQDRDKKNTWKIMHMYIDYDVYEKCLDMRKIEKMSVSFIINRGINKYLYEVKMKILNKIKTNDYKHNYVCTAKRHNNQNVISIFWDMPDIDVIKDIIY